MYVLLYPLKKLGGDSHLRLKFKDSMEKAIAGVRLEAEEILILLTAQPGDEEEALFFIADQIRREYLGDEVHLRGLMEFSNYCKRDCLYCGLRRSNRKVQRYRMDMEDMVLIALEAAAIGYKTIVLQSGEDPYHNVGSLAQIIGEIKERTDVAITLSIGERTLQEYQRLKDAGADRYLLKHETCDEVLYGHLHPGTYSEKRMQAMGYLGETGYQRGSGIMVGLPGQSLESIARDIDLFVEWDLDMVGIGPFIAHPDTPLGEAPNGSVELSLRALAVTRILLPYAHMPATTALETLDPKGRERALKAGANVIMPDITPAAYRHKYEIYPGKGRWDGGIRESRQRTEELVHSLGRCVALDQGHSVKTLRGGKKHDACRS
jgi:biotin synthase